MRRTERRERTREDLLAAATRLFAARGFGGASIDDVAKEAGYTSGAIYANFAGKEDLFLSAFEHQIARHVREVTSAVDEAEDRNAAAARQWMDFLDASPDLFLLFVEYWAYAVRDPERRAAFAERFGTFREATARMLGRDPEDDVVIAVNALVYGIAFQRLAEPEAVGDDTFANALDALLRGAR